jgi:phospholipid transport system substrate-binding protein
MLALPLTLLAGGARADAERAVEVVERFHAALIEAMQDGPDLGFAGRRARLAGVVARSFDLPEITRLVMGRYWEQLEAAQREAMVEAFSSLTIGTYAARFDEYGGERFEILEVREGRGGRIQVRSRLVAGAGTEVRFDYLLHERGGGWRIVNVLADGVSEITLRRAEYGAILEREDVGTLVGRIEAQVRELEAGS